jgi:hypothetical protein
VLGARLTTLLCKRINVAKSTEVKSGWSNSQGQTSLAESSKEGYDSKRALLMMMIMIWKEAVVA